MMMRRFRGFTRIELLVVIAILALPSAILMPALQRVRKQGRAVACLSLPKQWGLWFSMYAEEYGGPLDQSRRRHAEDWPRWMRNFKNYSEPRQIGHPSLRTVRTNGNIVISFMSGDNMPNLSW